MENKSQTTSDSTETMPDDSSIDQRILYCYCKTEDVSQFMICCEKCEEWFHGSCIKMDPEKARNISKWFCNECQMQFDLKIEYKISKKNRKNRKGKLFINEEGCLKQASSRCYKCTNCLQNKECGNSNYITPYKYKRVKYAESQVVHKMTCESNNNDENSNLSLNVTLSNTRRNKMMNFGKVGDKKTCYGLNCIKPARLNSKYCSDKCGVALAKTRILSLLPLRFEQKSQTPSVADELDRVKLQGIRYKKECTVKSLLKLKHQREKLEHLINRAKQLPILEVEEEYDDEKMQCITCGCEIHTRTAFKHMELCFRKHESQAEILSYKPDAIASEIFCNYHDEVRKTYCKRLRYLCPDHFKPEKVKDDEVCGCPLISVMSKNMFSETEKFCQRPMKKCDQHFYWDKLAHSEIDFECLRECNKVHNLINEEETIQEQITKRSGVLGILLHSTEEPLGK